MRIPIDCHLLTLRTVTYEIETRTIQTGRTSHQQRERVEHALEFPPHQDETGIRNALALVNQIWAPDIQFLLRRVLPPETTNAPDNTELVSVQGFYSLAREFLPQGGISALFVSRFSSTDLGGEADRRISVCIVGALGHLGTGKVLAHELGHLLELEHVTGTPHAGENLMYPAYPRPADLLTAHQRQQALHSAAARRFGVP
jgi:hypothetical protein